MKYFFVLLIALISGCNPSPEDLNKKGKQHYISSCAAIKAERTSHNRYKCICKDKNDCITVFTGQYHYEYITPVTIGKCAHNHVH